MTAEIIQIQSLKKRKGEIVKLIRKRLSLVKDGKVWVMRVWIADEGRYITKTLNEDYDKSVELAMKLYSEMKDRMEKGLQLKVKTLSEYVDLYIAELEMKQKNGQFSADRLKFHKFYLAELKSYWVIRKKPNIDEFLKGYNRNYERFKLTTKSIKSTSFNAIIQSHKQFNKWLLKNDLTKVEISIGVVKGFSKKDEFPLDRYDDLIKLMKAKAEEAHKDHYKSLRLSHLLMVQICREIGLRAVEVTNIRKSDLKGDKLVVRGKGKQREIQIPQSLIEKIRRFEADSRDADWLFTNNSGKRYKSVQNEYIKQCFNDIGIESDCSIGSIRHSFISERLRKGINPIHIAKYCGTSVGMIEKTYAHITPKDTYQLVFNS